MKTRLEELFDHMVDEAPVMFTPKMKPYILEFARTYAKEVAQKALEEAYDSFINAETKNEWFNTHKVITNPKNIKLD